MATKRIRKSIGQGVALPPAPRYATIEAFLQRWFVPGSAPSEHTVRRWLAKKIIPGIRFQRQWFVDLVALEADGDDLFERIIRAAAP